MRFSFTVYRFAFTVLRLALGNSVILNASEESVAMGENHGECSISFSFD
jgi:hypothetical protein